jgi:hypothetical protein
MKSEHNLDKRSKDPNPHNIILAVGLRIRIRIILGSCIRIRIRVKIFRSFRGTIWSRGGPGTLKIKVWRLKMETWRAADSHDFDEE